MFTCNEIIQAHNMGYRVPPEVIFSALGFFLNGASSKHVRTANTIFLHLSQALGNACTVPCLHGTARAWSRGKMNFRIFIIHKSSTADNLPVLVVS